MFLFRNPILLELRHPFRIATGMRTHTSVTLTEIRLGDYQGMGEAAMPPYYGETHETSMAFLERAAVLLREKGDRFWTIDPERRRAWIENIMTEIDELAPGNNAAKASVDIALHNLWSKIEGRPLYELLGIDPASMPPTSFTLGIDVPEILEQKLKEAEGFQIIKVKLGAGNDLETIRTVRQLSNLPIYADANQGWTDPHAALDLICELKELGVQLIEQPTPKNDLNAAAWLSARSPLPVFADESFQRLSDLEKVAGSFQGVNIKLMKCTGIAEAMRIVAAARSKKMQLMVGCMTETSIGIRAAATIAPLCDYADIDGCWLVKNNPFPLPALVNGRVVL